MCVGPESKNDQRRVLRGGVSEEREKEKDRKRERRRRKGGENRTEIKRGVKRGAGGEGK